MSLTTKIIVGALVFLAVVLAGYGLLLTTQQHSGPTIVVAPPDTGNVPATPNAPIPDASRMVVVASKNLPAHHIITPDDVNMGVWGQPLSEPYTIPSDLIGQVTLAPVVAGMPITKEQLAFPFAAHVPLGHRALAIKVDDVMGVAHRIHPGDRVDIYTLLSKNGDEIGLTSAQLLASNVLVLSHGDEILGSPTAPKKSADTTGVKTVVLALTPADVAPFLVAQGVGKVSLTLRATREEAVPTDKSKSELKGLAGSDSKPTSPPKPVQALVEKSKAVAPKLRTPEPKAATAPAPDERQVEVIRNGVRSTVNF